VADVSYRYNTTCTADRIETEIIELREKLPNILQQLEEVKENQLPQAMAHRAIDRAAVSTDYRLALRHYLNDEVSVITEITTPTTPSIQVSSLGVSHSRTTSEYWTAPTQRASETGLTTIPELCTQLFVSNVAIFKTLVIRVHSKDRIEKVKNNIRQRAALPNACFELPYAGHVLSEERSLEELNIAHNSTITCVSFRPNGRDERSIATPGTTYVAEAIISVRVKTPNGGIYHTVKVSEEVKQEDLVAFVASELSVLTGVDPEDTKLIHAGEVCRIGEPLHRPSIYLDGSIKMYLIIPGQEASDQQADYLESIFMSNRSDSTHPCPPSFEFDSEFTAKVHKVLSSVFEKDFVALVPLDAT